MNDLSQFDIPGMHKVEGITVVTAMPMDKIQENIRLNSKRDIITIDDTVEWREHPIAIVGGGPSLKTQLEYLKQFEVIVACGSVHDYLMSEGIIPTYTAVCDPDVIMNTYLTKRSRNTTFLVASQSDPSTFELLKDNKVVMWHLFNDVTHAEVHPPGTILIGGGCTVTTRAIVMMMGMGYYNQHLFGVDTGFNGVEHHAYDFVDPVAEEITDIHEIMFEVGGPKFKMAGYHLGQLFDIKALLSAYKGKINMTVHGDSVLNYVMTLAQKRKKLLEEQKNGIGNGLDGIGP